MVLPKMVLENVLFVNFLWPVTMTAYTSINAENTVGVSLTLTYCGFARVSPTHYATADAAWWDPSVVQ